MLRSNHSTWSFVLGASLLLLSVQSIAQELERWSVNPGIDNIRYQGKLFSTPDDYLMFVGAGHYAPALDSGYVAVVKLDHDGTILDHREYSLYNLPIIYDVAQVSGGYIVTGLRSGIFSDAFIMKIGDDLTLNWIRGPQSSQLSPEQFSTVVLADDSLHVFSSRNPGNIDTHKFTMDLDGQGWEVITSAMEDSSDVRIFDGVSTGLPGHFMVTGQVRDDENLNFESLIAHYGPSGVIWSRRIVFNDADYGSTSGISRTGDGNYWITYYNAGAVTGVFTSYLVKMNDDGEILMSNSYSRPDSHVIMDVPIEMDNGDLLVTGVQGATQIANLIKLTGEGEFIWAKTWEPVVPGNGRIIDLLKMPDASFRMLTGGDNLGITELDNSGDGCGFDIADPLDVSVVEVDMPSYDFSSSDSLTTEIDRIYLDKSWDYTSQQECTIVIGLEENINSHFFLSPNPASSYIQVQGINSIENWNYELFDLKGRMLDSQSYRHSIDVRSLDRGVYVIRLINEERTYSLSFLKTD